jgi:CRISPR/Cas system-associated endoribonuclease Cas2
MSSLYVLTYDVRAKNHDYQPLYDLLGTWGAAHLQNSVWLADMNGTAQAVRDAMMAKMHKDDTACVIQIFKNSGWATQNARTDGVQWLKDHCTG